MSISTFRRNRFLCLPTGRRNLHRRSPYRTSRTSPDAPSAVRRFGEEKLTHPWRSAYCPNVAHRAPGRLDPLQRVGQMVRHIVPVLVSRIRINILDAERILPLVPSAEFLHMAGLEQLHDEIRRARLFRRFPVQNGYIRETLGQRGVNRLADIVDRNVLRLVSDWIHPFRDGSPDSVGHFTAVTSRPRSARFRAPRCAAKGPPFTLVHSRKKTAPPSAGLSGYVILFFRKWAYVGHCKLYVIRTSSARHPSVPVRPQPSSGPARRTAAPCAATVPAARRSRHT